MFCTNVYLIDIVIFIDDTGIAKLSANDIFSQSSESICHSKKILLAYYITAWKLWANVIALHYNSFVPITN